MEEKKNTHIWSWIAFGFFALLALAYLPYFAGFMALAVAIIVLPLMKWQDLLKRVLPKRVRIAILVLLALLSVFTAPAVENEAPTFPAESTTWSEETSQSTTEEVTTQATTQETTLAPTEPSTEESTASTTEPPTKATTAPTTEPPTQETTTPTTEPPTQETTAPTTEPPTQETTAPSTEPPTEETTVPVTESPTEESTVPPTTEAETTQPSVLNERSYVVNTNTGKFHYPSCSSVKDIKDENRWDYFGTRESLTDMGYVACKRCKP